MKNYVDNKKLKLEFGNLVSHIFDTNLRHFWGHYSMCVCRGGGGVKDRVECRF